MKEIQKEKSYLQEAINTFSKLIAQYRTRPRLTPEQEVGLATFEMARSDTKVKQSALGQEEREIEHYFHVATGHGLKEIEVSYQALLHGGLQFQSMRQKNCPRLG